MLFMGLVWAIYFCLMISEVRKKMDNFNDLCKYSNGPCNQGE